MLSLLGPLVSPLIALPERGKRGSHAQERKSKRRRRANSQYPRKPLPLFLASSSYLVSRSSALLAQSTLQSSRSYSRTLFSLLAFARLWKRGKKKIETTTPATKIDRNKTTQAVLTYLIIKSRIYNSMTLNCQDFYPSKNCSHENDAAFFFFFLLACIKRISFLALS